MFLLNDQGRVLVGQRRDMAADAWQMPQGGIDPPETPVEAALREMLEEIGTDRALLLRESGVWRSYDLPPIARARQSWRGRYAGQTQKWLAYPLHRQRRRHPPGHGAPRVQRLALGRRRRRCRT